MQQCRKSSSFRPTSKDGHEEVGVHNQIVWRTGNENLEPYDSSLYLPILADTPRINIGLSWPCHSSSRGKKLLVQDLFGTCMCLMFAKIIKLNGIHVASILLIVAFSTIFSLFYHALSVVGPS
jgi:hypothetical protein